MMFNYLILSLLVFYSLNGFCDFKDDFTYKAEISFFFRQFQADDNDNNNDQQIAGETKLSTTWEAENTKVHLGAFGRIDQDDERRNIVNFDEAYIKTMLNKWSISFGNHIFNWSVLEIFHPVDSINARNLDANADLIERLGQPSIIITREFETSILQFIPLLKTVAPVVPSRYNRNGPQLDLNKPKFIEDDDQSTQDPHMFEWVVRYLHNFEKFDLDIHVARKYDTLNPVIASPKTGNVSPTIEDLTIVPYYLPVTQYGIAVQGTYEELIYKFEHINYDFDNYHVEFFIPPTILFDVSKKDFSLTAIGLEYSKAYENDQEGTYFLEYQTILGTTIEEARTLSPFQRDIALGYRHNFNDFKGHEIISAIIYDLDLYDEMIFNLSHSFRLTESWKLTSQVRVVEAPAPSSEASLDNFSGLKPIANSDNISFKLTKFF